MDRSNDVVARSAPVLPPAVAGALAAASALAAAELLAGAIGALVSPIAVIGDRVIDIAPPALKDVAIATLGTADKPVLQIGTIVLGMLLGALLGIVAWRSWTAGAIGFAAVGVLGIAATVDSPRASLLLMTLVIGTAVAFGLLVLHRLLVPRGYLASAVDDRRRLLLAGAIGVAAVGAGAAGRWLLGRGDVDATRTAFRLPQPDVPLAPRPDGLDVDGVSPLFTPNDSFYRIDTALVVPRVEAASWALGVTGLVDRERSWTYDELRGMATAEADVTIACVSNEVGGGLVGTARWQGIWLRDLLDAAGVRPEARQIVGRSVDGFTAAFPVAAVADGRAAMVALAMNGEPLPVAHGFPARLVVPGLYGYVSATKWLERIELVTEDFDGYWVPRGWAKRAPIKTQSRIDVPRRRARLPAGRVAIAGVAWAPTRGIRAVEVRVDDGPWQPADLGPPVGDDTWRQWVRAWDAAPGRHRLQVRATDGDGRVQTADAAPPRPDGATGHHTIDVEITEA